MKRAFRFQFFTSNVEPLLHQARDLSIIMELSEILFNRNNYVFTTAFMNYPGIPKNAEFPYKFSKDDLMIMPTRPPQSDTESLHKRIIYRTGHELEEAMFSQVKRCFISLSRNKSNLHLNLKRKFSADFKNHGEIEFRVNKTGKTMSAAHQKVTNCRIGVA